MKGINRVIQVIAIILITCLETPEFNSVLAWSEDQAQILLKTKQCPGCDLRGINLTYADLTGVNLSGANLRGANLSGVILIEANLSEVKLNRANLSGAILNGANLSGADLSFANLRQASLHKARISKPINLTGANLELVTMPNGQVRQKFNKILKDIIYNGEL